MKKFVLMIIVSINVFALEITKKVMLSDSINSDSYSLSISVSKFDKDKDNIEKEFQKAIEYAKDIKICEGGRYNIYPEYKYLDKIRKFSNYNGYISFTCIFQDESKVEEFLNDLNRLDELKISQGKIIPTLSDKEKKQLDMNLEKQVYSYAKEYVHFLRTELEKKCITKKIKFITEEPIHRPMVRSMRFDSPMETTRANIIKPLDDMSSRTLFVKYTFKCDD